MAMRLGVSSRGSVWVSFGPLGFVFLAVYCVLYAVFWSLVAVGWVLVQLATGVVYLVRRRG